MGSPDSGNQQKRRDEDLDWKERRGRTLSVAVDSFDSEIGRQLGLSEGELGLGTKFEPPGFAEPSREGNLRKAKSEFTRAFERPGDKITKKESPGYTETQVKPFTITDIVDTESAEKVCAKREERGGENKLPAALSKPAVQWIYFQIWLYFYGFRSICCLLQFHARQIIFNQLNRLQAGLGDSLHHRPNSNYTWLLARIS